MYLLRVSKNLNKATQQRPRPQSRECTHECQIEWDAAREWVTEILMCNLHR